MKILGIDLKQGLVRVIPESTDDLWLLSRILKPGDEVRARTVRKETIYRDGEVIQGERKPMWLRIRAEKIELQEGRLRVLGQIVEGPARVRLGSYHSLELEPGQKLEIYREWKGYELERIRKASRKPRVWLLLIDREGAELFELRESGLKHVGKRVFRKTEKEERERWYQELADWIERPGYLILAGPGFEAENLFNWIKSRKPGLSGRIWLEHSYSLGLTGAREVLRRAGGKLLKQFRLARETELIERFLEELKKDGKVVYGYEETKRALEAGAVEVLMISEAKLKEAEELMDLAEANRAKIEILGTGWEAGDIFLGLGGIGAFLRFKWT